MCDAYKTESVELAKRLVPLKEHAMWKVYQLVNMMAFNHTKIFGGILRDLFMNKKIKNKDIDVMVLSNNDKEIINQLKGERIEYRGEYYYIDAVKIYSKNKYNFDNHYAIWTVGFKTKGTCNVCLKEDIRYENMNRIKGCGHRFCTNCIERMSETENPKCPLCRGDFKIDHHTFENWCKMDLVFVTDWKMNNLDYIPNGLTLHFEKIDNYESPIKLWPGRHPTLSVMDIVKENGYCTRDVIYLIQKKIAIPHEVNRYKQKHQIIRKKKMENNGFIILYKLDESTERRMIENMYIS